MNAVLTLMHMNAVLTLTHTVEKVVRINLQVSLLVCFQNGYHLVLRVLNLKSKSL